MAEHKLSIEYLSVDDLTPYENNARKHNDEDVSMIENSIEQFDFNDPIGVWGENNIIVEGHGRLLAAKKAGLTEVPCIRLDHLTEEQRKAYTLAHNKTAENSIWDFDVLADELADIQISQ
jgi:ParB-like chromosome segregation protein Spo0J